MAKVKPISKGPSIQTTFIAYITISLLVACMLSFISLVFCHYQKYQIYRTYESQVAGEKSMDGGRLTLFYSGDISAYYSDTDKKRDEDLHITSLAIIPVWFILCVVITSSLFYNRKLKIPLEVLDAATEKIADNNLDFKVSYHDANEFGRLCASFEKMRTALQENNHEMWRQMEGLKRLSAVFSHDLRTPLTVLKGRSDLILKYVPEGKMSAEKIVATMQTMRAHIVRLENYVQTMNNLQKLEDIEICKSLVKKEDIVAMLEGSAEIICVGKEFVFSTEGFTENTAFLDMPIVQQVYENIISNAVRYAKRKVIIQLTGAPFSISVLDDGPGFSSQDLHEATKPFYRANSESNGQHFGMGLSICKILCEKHGGGLALSNGKTGATVKAVF